MLTASVDVANRGMPSPARLDGFCLSLIAIIKALSIKYIFGRFLASGLSYDSAVNLLKQSRLTRNPADPAVAGHPG